MSTAFAFAGNETNEFQPTDPERFMDEKEMQRVADEAIQRAKDLLIMLPTDKRKQEETEVRAKAIKDYEKDRINGRANDTYNYCKPGIRIYITTIGLQEMESMCRAYGIALQRHELKPVDDFTWEITLERGGYCVTPSGIEFYKDHEITARRDIKHTQSFGLPRNRMSIIKRIEGLSSTVLWQNQKHNWDLSPKTPEQLRRESMETMG